jgi:hypothetical protein
MDKKYLANTIEKVKPLFRLWSEDEELELEARVFLCSKETENKNVPAGVPKDGFDALLERFQKECKVGNKMESMDCSMNDLRYSFQGEGERKELKAVLKKTAIRRLDSWAVDLGVGYRINLKKETPVVDAPSSD